MMDQTIKDFLETREFIALYGRQTIQALLILIIGLIAIPYIKKGIKYVLARFGLKQRICGTIANVLGILLLLFTILIATKQAGMDSANVTMVLKGAALVAIAGIFIFRPYLPTLPFNVGNVVKTGDLLGKVEATTVLNTRVCAEPLDSERLPDKLPLYIHPACQGRCQYQVRSEPYESQTSLRGCYDQRSAGQSRTPPRCLCDESQKWLH